MRKIALITLIALASGCSMFQTASRNLLAFNCANGAMILKDLPTIGNTQNQLQDLENAACATAFGTTAAPASAPGEGPVFPAGVPATK